MSAMPKWALFCFPMLLGVSGVHAECMKWDVSHIELDQSNGTGVELNLSVDGDVVSGKAIQSFVSSGGFLTGGDPRSLRGDVQNGVLKGSRLEFDVMWNGSGDRDAATGVYKLNIDEAGRLSGTTSDFNRPSSRAHIRGYRQIRCAQQQGNAQQTGAGTVRRLGKRIPPPGSAPRSESNEAGRALAGAESRCRTGLVWREAFDGDGVCVTPERRAMVREENRQAASRRDPHGAYGPNSCIAGFVWREAGANDTVCVAPEERSRIREENRIAH